MLLDRVAPSSEVADVLIVGAGAVGLTMGLKLARAGRRVMICEAGGASLDPAWRERNVVVQTGRTHVGSTEGRYRGLGGTTRLWGGQLMPFTARDLAPDPSLGKPGWPIELTALMEGVDEVLRLTGVAQSWAEAEEQWCTVTGQGLDLGSELRLAPSLWLPQPDFAKLFGAELRRSSNLRVLTGHEAIGVTVRPNGSVSGLRLRSGDGSETSVSGAATVLAAGTLETARLLLRAKAELSTSPLGGNRHVGQWFFDHLHGVAGEVTPIDRAGFGRLFDSFYFGGRKLMPKVRPADGAASLGPTPNCAGSFVGPMSPGLVVEDARSLLRRIVGSGEGKAAAVGEAWQMARLILPLAFRYLAERRSSNFIGSKAGFRIEMEQLPSEASFLALEEGTPLEHARLRVNWSLDGTPIEGFSRFAQAIGAYCVDAGLGAVELDPLLLAGDPAYFVACRDSNHHMGGARMAQSAAQGVVDASGQVFGLPGLYVAGAAVFPSGSFANPTLVGMALGQLLAGHLLDAS